MHSVRGRQAAGGLTVLVSALLAVMPVDAWGQKMATAAVKSERFTDWTRPLFPAAEYAARRTAALAQLGANDVLLVPSAEGTSGGETFRQLDDFEYFVGLEVSRSLLVLDGRTRRASLLVPGTDPRFDNPARPNDFPGRALAADKALRALSGVDAVLIDLALDSVLAALTERGARVLVNLGSAPRFPNTPPARFTSPSAGDALAVLLARRQPTRDVANAYGLIASLRMRKSEREIAALRRAAGITAVAIEQGGARVRAGVDERTLTGAFLQDCLAGGAQREAFTPIIKSGANSLWPWRILGAHYDRRNRVMRAGELVIYDVGCELDHYVSDVGRTFPVAERFTPRQRDLVEMVRHISDAVIAAAKPGITLGDLQRVAIGATPVAERRFMQAPLYFGHHLGLDTSDPSLADAPLAPGMVFTIEPWYYNHEDHVAVFLEDEILITASGSENLTAALPRDADGLEQMRRGARRVENKRVTSGSAIRGDVARQVTRDGVLSFALDRSSGTVVVRDLLNSAVVAMTSVCRSPRSGQLSDDDVSFIVQCAGTPSVQYINTASYAVVAAPLPTARPTPVMTPQLKAKNEVTVVGTIHSEHLTSQRYSTSVLRDLLVAMRPDYVLTEIAPNRFDAASREFAKSGTISEPRVVRFPEYTDVLFPLTKAMAFTIVPTAGWSRPMDQYRTAALKRIEADTARRVAWLEYRRANIVADSLVALHGADNPYFINSVEYDAIMTAAHEPYNRLFNMELGPGGWDNINVSHYGNIARTLDAHRGEGKRFVITYGAGHKEWFMRELRRRTDVVILEVAPFLERIGAKR